MKTTYEPERGAARKPASSFLDLVDDDSCDWRQLALGMAALLGQSPPSNNEDLLTDVARQLTSPVATLRAQAARLEQAATTHPSEEARELAVRIVEQADHVADWVDAILDRERLRLGKAHLELRKRTWSSSPWTPSRSSRPPRRASMPVSPRGNRCSSRSMDLA
jgi:signal transduction histidine kinase